MRRRSTWIRGANSMHDAAGQPPAIPGESSVEIPATEYGSGDPSDWGEAPYSRPRWKDTGEDYENSPVDGFPGKRSDTDTDRQFGDRKYDAAEHRRMEAAYLQRKSLECTRVAEVCLGKKASDEAVENIAVAFMNLPDESVMEFSRQLRALRPKAWKSAAEDAPAEEDKEKKAEDKKDDEKEAVKKEDFDKVKKAFLRWAQEEKEKVEEDEPDEEKAALKKEDLAKTKKAFLMWAAEKEDEEKKAVKKEDFDKMKKAFLSWAAKKDEKKAQDEEEDEVDEEEDEDEPVEGEDKKDEKPDFDKMKKAFLRWSAEKEDEEKKDEACSKKGEDEKKDDDKKEAVKKEDFDKMKKAFTMWAQEEKEKVEEDEPDEEKAALKKEDLEKTKKAFLRWAEEKKEEDKTKKAEDEEDEDEEKAGEFFEAGDDAVIDQLINDELGPVEPMDVPVDLPVDDLNSPIDMIGEEDLSMDPDQIDMASLFTSSELDDAHEAQALAGGMGAPAKRGNVQRLGGVPRTASNADTNLSELWVSDPNVDEKFK